MCNQQAELVYMARKTGATRGISGRHYSKIWQAENSMDVRNPFAYTTSWCSALGKMNRKEYLRQML